MIYSGSRPAYIYLVIIVVVSLNVFTFLGNAMRNFTKKLSDGLDKWIKRLTKINKKEEFALREGMWSDASFNNWAIAHQAKINDLSGNLNKWLNDNQDNIKQDISNNYNNIKTSYNILKDGVSSYVRDITQSNIASGNADVSLNEILQRTEGHNYYFSRDYNNKLTTLEKRRIDKELIAEASKFRTTLMFGGVFLGAVLIAGLYDKFKFK